MVWAGEEGFEPSNAGIKIRSLNRLGDSPINLGYSDTTMLTCGWLCVSVLHQLIFQMRLRQRTSLPQEPVSACCLRAGIAL